MDLEQLASIHEEVFDNRSEHEGGNISQCADEQHCAHKQSRKEWTRDWKGAWSSRDQLLASERPRQGQDRDDHREAPKKHREAQRGVIPRRIRGEACKGTAVVAGGGTVGVEDLGESMRAAVVRPVAQEHRQRRQVPIY